MTFTEYTKGMNIFIHELPEPDAFLAEVRGISPDGEMIILDIEMTECTTRDMVLATLQAELEELFDLRYNYSTEEPISETLLYDGGEFK